MSAYWLIPSASAGGSIQDTSEPRAPTASQDCQRSVLDPSFGKNGVAMISFVTGQDYARSVAMQPDGRIVVAGTACAEPSGYCGLGTSRFSFALARFMPDGAIDTSFGVDGKATTIFGNHQDTAYSVAIQPDGGIVAAGTSVNFGLSTMYIALARYKPDGSLDETFGDGGKVLTLASTGLSAAAYSVALQSDGRIVVAGQSEYPDYTHGFGLVRYNPDGSLDISFGIDGKVSTRIRNRDSLAYAVTIQPDGLIVAVGHGLASLLFGTKGFAVARYLPDGTPDTSFNGNGHVVTAIGTRHSEAFTVAIAQDGKILAAGHSDIGQYNNEDFALIRYNSDGTLDMTFGLGGKVTTPIFAGSLDPDLVFSLVLYPDGRIGAAGKSGDRFAIARYHYDGSLDNSLNGTGTVTTPVGPYGSGATSAVLRPDGKVIAAGYSVSLGGADFTLLRYLAPCRPTTLTPIPTDSTTAILTLR